jgi:hypothetical protein
VKCCHAIDLSLDSAVIFGRDYVAAEPLLRIVVLSANTHLDSYGYVEVRGLALDKKNRVGFAPYDP